MAADDRTAKRLARRRLCLAAGASVGLLASVGGMGAAGAQDNVPRVDLDKLKRPAQPAPPSNLFNSRSWETRAPPKKAPPPPPPPPPQAPPLPFTYVGRWIERGETTVMLGRGGRNYTVREGEKIDASYLLEKIEADKLVFRYTPLDQTQVLAFGAAAPAPAVPAPGAMPPTIGIVPPRTNNPLSPTQTRRGATRDPDDEED